MWELIERSAAAGGKKLRALLVITTSAEHMNDKNRLSADLTLIRGFANNTNDAFAMVSGVSVADALASIGVPVAAARAVIVMEHAPDRAGILQEIQTTWGINVDKHLALLSGADKKSSIIAVDLRACAHEAPCSRAIYVTDLAPAPAAPANAARSCRCRRRATSRASVAHVL